MAGENTRITLDLPQEFLELCEHDLVSPERVLKEFIADLCSLSGVRGGYARNASEDGDRARDYYDRIHRWKADWMQANLPNFVRQWRARHEPL